jgi:hypothetical protein
MYHGWADPFVPSQFSIDIYAGIIEHDAEARELPFDLDPVLDVSSQPGLAGRLAWNRGSARRYCGPPISRHSATRRPSPACSWCRE